MTKQFCTCAKTIVSPLVLKCSTCNLDAHPSAITMAKQMGHQIYGCSRCEAMRTENPRAKFCTCCGTAFDRALQEKIEAQNQKGESPENLEKMSEAMRRFQANNPDFNPLEHSFLLDYNQ